MTFNHLDSFENCIVFYHTNLDQLSINIYFGGRCVNDCSNLFTYLCRDFICFDISEDEGFTKFK